MLAKGLIGLVCLIHALIFLAETVFYRSWGVKVFRIKPEDVDARAAAMSNQGCYNGFLVVALLLGLVYPEPGVAKAFATYGLLCVAVAGVWGAVTVARKVLFVQTVPAVLGLVFLFW